MFEKGCHSFVRKNVTEFSNFHFSVCNCRRKPLQRHNDLQLAEVGVLIRKNNVYC